MVERNRSCHISARVAGDGPFAPIGQPQGDISVPDLRWLGFISWISHREQTLQEIISAIFVEMLFYRGYDAIGSRRLPVVGRNGGYSNRHDG